MKKTSCVAFSGVLSALGIVIMLMGIILPFSQYAVAMLSGIAAVAIVIECGKVWAALSYCAVSLLSVLLLPDKEPAFLYILFFGYYPIVKSLFESIKNVILEWLCKLALFNAAMIAVFFAGMYILSIPDEEYTVFGIYMPWLILALGNILFVVYDILISRTVVIYLVKIHPFCKKLFNLHN